jgi:multimeric flavodoxin WrbA
VFPGSLDPEAEWSPIRDHTGAAKMEAFWHRFAPFWLKNGSKTPEKGPKSASSGYLSVNRMIL